VVVTPARPADVVDARMNLPIVAMEQEVMELVSDSDVLVLCGETGCGKTTQMPQFLYEAGYGQPDGGDRRCVCVCVCVCDAVSRDVRERSFSVSKTTSFGWTIPLSIIMTVLVRHGPCTRVLKGCGELETRGCSKANSSAAFSARSRARK